MRIPVQPLPEGSAIQLREEPLGVDLSWKVDDVPWLARGLVGVFLLAWLVGWAAGEWSAISQLLRGFRKGGWWGPGEFFLLFWLCGWSVGGLVGIGLLALLFAPSTPEQLSLRDEDFVFRRGFGLTAAASRPDDDDENDVDEYAPQKTPPKPGVPAPSPPRIAANAPPPDLAAWRKSYRPREIARSEVKAFQMDRPAGPWRLYFDLGVDRIEIGSTLADADRFWLYELLETWRTRRPLETRPWLDGTDDPDDDLDDEEEDSDADQEDAEGPDEPDDRFGRGGSLGPGRGLR